MQHVPRKLLSDEFAVDRGCAVCGEPELRVVHVEHLPDYVKCVACGSAFILSESGDWALFGSVSSDFPQTKHMVLKRWTTLEAVRAMASSEQSKETPSESSGVSLNPTPPFGFGGQPPIAKEAPTPPFGIDGNSHGAEQAATPPFGIGELDGFAAKGSNRNSNPSLLAAEPLEQAADVSEPDPDRRYFVTLTKKHVVLPKERCAHCLRRPAPRKLLIGMDQDSDPGYEVPLCQSCHDRAGVRSEEQKTSRLVAHLSAVLIAGVLIVAVLAAGLINIGNLGVIDLVAVGVLGLVGYGIPVVLLLRRSSNLPRSEDAQFVRSTLRLRSEGGLGFGWRNRGYAELFSSANAKHLLGDVEKTVDEPPQPR